MKKGTDLSSKRAALMSGEGPGVDRFALAASITETRPTGTGARAAPAPSPSTPSDPDGLQVVAVDEVVENPLNARHAYQEKRINDLAASIAQRGQLTPALACDLGEVLPILEGSPLGEAIRRLVADSPRAKYLLIGGHYRKKALTKLARPIELKLVKVASLLDLYALSYAENDEREDTTPLDDALSWQNLLELQIAKTQEDISKVTNKPRTTIVKTLAILKLPQEILDVFKEAAGKYSYLAAYSLTQLAPHVTRDRLMNYAHQVAEGSVTTRELEAALAAATANSPRKTKEISRQHKLHAEGQEVGVLKEWDSGRVLLDIRIQDQQARESLVAEFRKRYGGDADQQLQLK